MLVSAEISILLINSAHLDAGYAKTTMFGKRIAHGILSAGFIFNVLGDKLPGKA